MRLLATILILSLALSPIDAYADLSIIATIENSKQAVVIIRADTGGLARSPHKAFRDAKTGRIIVATKLMAAQYSREGAGIIIDHNGTIVTNSHNVLGAKKITVVLHDQKEVSCQVLQVVPGEDLAFIRINMPDGIEPIKFSRTINMRLRDRVYHIGTSELLEGTISMGRITGIGKLARAKGNKTQYADLLQTDFNIYKRDSGGPLLDTTGNLAGLMVATKVNKNHVSFAIPAWKIAKYYNLLT